MNKFRKSHETVNSGETNIKNQLLNLVKKYDSPRPSPRPSPWPSPWPRLNIFNLKVKKPNLNESDLKTEYNKNFAGKAKHCPPANKE